MPKLIFSFLLLFCFYLCGCGCSEDDMTTGFGPRCDDALSAATGADGGTGTLLASDQGGSAIREFTGISTLEGNVETDPPLTGGLTRLTSPQYLTIHPTNSDLIVADEGANAIFFFSNPTGIDGNVPPNRVLTGVATEMSGPVQTFVDSTTDELYVLDRGSSRVLIYNNASTIEGDVAPDRRLGGPTSAISSPNGFIFRASSEQISVLNAAEILTFNNFRTVNGDPPPAGRFGGAATTFSSLTYGEITSGGTLIVADSGADQILSFDNFQFDQLNEAPTRFVRGNNTGLSEPRQFVITSDTMYIANNGEVLVFDQFSTQDGNPFPNRRFTGLNPATQSLRGLVFP